MQSQFKFDSWTAYFRKHCALKPNAVHRLEDSLASTARCNIPGGTGSFLPAAAMRRAQHVQHNRQILHMEGTIILSTKYTSD